MGDGTQGPRLDFRLADPEGRIVGDTSRPPGGTASPAELERGIPIRVDGQVVGYLLPSPQALKALPLDSSQAEFLDRVRNALWIAALAALAAALVIGGLLFCSIVTPLHRLTAASHAVAEGDLSARAPVQGRDEVAQLADAFNRMAESLAHAEDARRYQTADIAHELRTPLTVIQGTLEAMLDGVYSTDRENLLAALGQVRTLARLVEDLRLLALADAGQLPLQAAPLDLGAFLQDVVEAYRPRALERETTLRLEAPSALSPVLADRDRLAQVVGNLLENALRYVPQGGRITVCVTRQGWENVVAVADNGPGVRPEDLPHLFERFWRGDPARQRSTGGSGLGLTIARHIVKAHGGRIWAENLPEGGLQVSFSLPVA
jgi:signal transduction histidine kinase